jgi:hypothetical protein
MNSDRLPAREAGIRLVPVRDCVFGHFPAKMDYAPLANEGKIHEARADVLYLDALIFEVSHLAFQFFGQG